LGAEAEFPAAGPARRRPSERGREPGPASGDAAFEVVRPPRRAAGRRRRRASSESSVEPIPASTLGAMHPSIANVRFAGARLYNKNRHASAASASPPRSQAVRARARASTLPDAPLEARRPTVEAPWCPPPFRSGERVTRLTSRARPPWCSPPDRNLVLYHSKRHGLYKMQRETARNPMAGHARSRS